MHSPKSDKFRSNKQFLDRMLMHSPKSDKFRPNKQFSNRMLADKIPVSALNSFKRSTS